MGITGKAFSFMKNIPRSLFQWLPVSSYFSKDCITLDTSGFFERTVTIIKQDMLKVVVGKQAFSRIKRTETKLPETESRW